MKYLIDGNNRESYDILLEHENGDLQFIAEFMNEDNAYLFIEAVTKQEVKDN